MEPYTIGVDTGGTFADIVAIRDDGTLFTAKALTTPSDQSSGVMEAVATVARKIGITTPDLPAFDEHLNARKHGGN